MYKLRKCLKYCFYHYLFPRHSDTFQCRLQNIFGLKFHYLYDKNKAKYFSKNFDARDEERMARGVGFRETRI